MKQFFGLLCKVGERATPLSVAVISKDDLICSEYFIGWRANHVACYSPSTDVRLAYAPNMHLKVDRAMHAHDSLPSKPSARSSSCIWLCRQSSGLGRTYSCVAYTEKAATYTETLIKLLTSPKSWSTNQPLSRPLCLAAVHIVWSSARKRPG